MRLYSCDLSEKFNTKEHWSCTWVKFILLSVSLKYHFLYLMLLTLRQQQKKYINKTYGKSAIRVETDSDTTE